MLLGPGVAPCQSSWEYARPHAFASIIAEQRKMVLEAFAADPERSIALGGISFPSLPTIQYMDSTRPISPERLDLIRRWILSYGIGLRTLEEYEQEALFREGSLDLWLPVKTEIVPHLDGRLARGDPVTLFAVWVGARGKPESIDWVFLVYGFRDQPPKQD